MLAPADEVLAAFEGFVHDDRETVFERLCVRLQSDRSEEACWPVEELRKLFGLHGAQFDRADGAHQLGLVDLVVAAQERGNAVPRVLACPLAPCFSAI